MTLQHKEGFISLFTVLLATVILAIAVGMSSVALKQIVLASTADDANEAFYAADAALQCAIMLDIDGTFEVGGPNEVFCGDIGPITIDDGDSGIFIFNQTQNGFEWQNQNCTRVRVDKSDTMTKIEALGYNVSCSEIGQSPRTVERALRVRYGI
jgi:hypothetical protein